MTNSLKEKLRSLRAERNIIETKIAECEQSLLNEHHIEIMESLASKDEPYGDVTIGDIKFKIPKYVKWDKAKLEEIALELDNPQDYIDYSLSVSETKLKMMPDYLKSRFTEARKVTAGKININFKE